MPRETIKLKNRVESLSILDADGKVDKSLEPKISDADLKKLFRAMTLSRRYDERMLKLQRQGRIGTYGPALGQEAASLGPAYVLKKEDWLVPSFREPAAMLYRGWPMDKLMLWWGGNEFGSAPPDGVNDMPICVPVASQVQYGAGIAWGLKLQKKKAIVLGFVGDGGTSEGDFHEGMNCAAIFGAPFIMVIQNNQWAISLPRAKQSASETLAQKALAYGIDGIQCDGNDILAMIVATREAAEKARAGGGPTIIEAVTYRLGVHTTADDPKKYRTDEEVECWKLKDPLLRFWKYVHAKNIVSEKERDAMEVEIQEQISAAVKKTESFEPDILEPFHHCYADMTPELKRQMNEFKEYLNESAPGGSSGGAPAGASGGIGEKGSAHELSRNVH